ncbi:MAG: ECF transporter S component [Clostridiales bacterium]|nr:ECF transporter S component [Clostridiales bacterium]
MSGVKNSKTRKLTMIAMLCALAYVIMVVGRIPLVLFLKYDPKDIVIVIGGFIFGPLAAAAISVVVAVVEMFTVSDTGVIGLFMNIISSLAFACVAAFVYKKKRTMSGAVMGLALGVVVMTALMLLWNYIITPLYMNVSRQEVIDLLVPVFLPFNLVKGGINMALTILLYKPVVTALRKARLIPEDEYAAPKVTKAKSLGLMFAALALLATCILVVLAINGII